MGVGDHAVLCTDLSAQGVLDQAVDVDGHPYLWIMVEHKQEHALQLRTYYGCGGI